MQFESPKDGAEAPAQSVEAPASAEDWWHGALIYHIYLRSFRDSNGDGIGDLRGCIEGLDYIASLGADAIWLSPFFTSPMHDFGYDVADYCDVDPVFGTLADFDELVAQAHKRGLKVVIDQVYSHSSDEHAWFEESRQDRTNPKADWYVWADSKPDGSPPSNWQAVFGGGTWEWDNRRHQYYLHNFLASQPDLNLHNVEVQDAVLDVARFWLDRGVDGFRLDAINFAMHDPELRDNPAIEVADRASTKPFDSQDHLYNQSHPGIVTFIERIRALTDSYPGRFTVAEVGGTHALAEMKDFTAGNTRLNSAYSFDYLYADELNADLVRKTMLDWPGGKDEGWPSWAFSNHDSSRAERRWANGRFSEEYAKFALMLLMSLRGNVFLYQGEELGLQQAEIPFEKLQDPEAIANWPETLGRDGARTPIPWSENDAFAGFSKSEPWLPIDPRHIPKAIDRQDNEPDSVLNFARRMISLRARLAPLCAGNISFLETPDNVLAFVRTRKDESVLCVFNFSLEEVSWSPADAADWSTVISANVAPAPEPGQDQEPLPQSLAPESGYIAIRSR